MAKNISFTLFSLIILTILTALISQYTALRMGVVLILALTSIKFLLVAFQYMDLKKAHVFWKISLSGILLLFMSLLIVVLW